MSFLDVLSAFAARGGDTAFTYMRGFRTVRWSYEEIANTAYQISNELKRREIQKGDRILLWGHNSAQWVATFFGILIHGAIVVPLDVDSDPGFVIRVQQQAKPRFAVVDDTIGANVPLEIPAMALGEFLSSARQQPYQTNTIADIKLNQTAELVFTSGTTAEPKGVRITHGNLLASLNAIEQVLRPYLKWTRFAHPIRFLNLVPLSHVFGQLMAMLVPHLVGGEVFFQDSINSTRIIETTKREGISVIVAVPRILRILRDRIEETSRNNSQLEEFREEIAQAEKHHFIVRGWIFRRVHRMFGWKFFSFISGGATLDKETELFWRRLGFAVIQGYGLTETAGLITVNDPFRTNRGSIGRLLTGQEVKIEPDGELLVRGPNVSPGYWLDEPSTANAGDKWFHTGDIVEMDNEGNLYFKARKKDMIVTSAGVNIYPEDIESILNRDPQVRTSAVIELQTPQGPEPVAVLIARDEGANPKEIIERVNKSLAPHQRIRRWFMWPANDFPRTVTQKLRKQAIADQVKQYLIGAPPVISQSQPITDVLERIGSDSAVNPKMTLGPDLKLDSLARVELLSAIEDRYQIEIDEAALTDMTTVAGVEEIIRERRQPAEGRYPYPQWQHHWPMNWFRILLLHGIVFNTIRLLGWPRISGAERLRNLNGPIVFVSNHVTMIDHALILFALPVRFSTNMVIAQDGEILREWRYPPPGNNLFRRLWNLIEYFLVVLFFNVFSMPQKSGFRRSFTFAGQMIDRGYNLMIFPEGERTKHGAMNPFQAGTGLLIRELDVTVVPIRIDGLSRLNQAHRHIAWPGEISVVIGDPVSYSIHDSPAGIASDLADRVRSL